MSADEEAKEREVSRNGKGRRIPDLQQLQHGRQMLLGEPRIAEETLTVSCHLSRPNVRRQSVDRGSVIVSALDPGAVSKRFLANGRARLGEETSSSDHFLLRLRMCLLPTGSQSQSFPGHSWKRGDSLGSQWKTKHFGRVPQDFSPPRHRINRSKLLPGKRPADNKS